MLLNQIQQHLLSLGVLLRSTSDQGTSHGKSRLCVSSSPLETVQGGGSGPKHGQGPGKVLAC